MTSETLVYYPCSLCKRLRIDPRQLCCRAQGGADAPVKVEVSPDGRGGKSFRVVVAGQLVGFVRRVKNSNPLLGPAAPPAWEAQHKELTGMQQVGHGYLKQGCGMSSWLSQSLSETPEQAVRKLLSGVTYVQFPPLPSASVSEVSCVNYIECSQCSRAIPCQVPRNHNYLTNPHTATCPNCGVVESTTNSLNIELVKLSRLSGFQVVAVGRTRKGWVLRHPEQPSVLGCVKRVPLGAGWVFVRPAGSKSFKSPTFQTIKLATDSLLREVPLKPLGIRNEVRASHESVFGNQGAPTKIATEFLCSQAFICSNCGRLIDCKAPKDHNSYHAARCQNCNLSVKSEVGYSLVFKKSGNKDPIYDLFVTRGTYGDEVLVGAVSKRTDNGEWICNQDRNGYFETRRKAALHLASLHLRRASR